MNSPIVSRATNHQRRTNATQRCSPSFAELSLSRSDAERSMRDAVKHARECGCSWAFIGSLVGTSGEAARQRYGHKQNA